MVDALQVTQFYTAPTLIRSLMQAGDQHVKGDLSSLKVLGSVGEPINPSEPGSGLLWHRLSPRPGSLHQASWQISVTHSLGLQATHCCTCVCSVLPAPEVPTHSFGFPAQHSAQMLLECRRLALTAAHCCCCRRV